MDLTLTDEPPTDRAWATLIDKQCGSKSITWEVPCFTYTQAYIYNFLEVNVWGQKVHASKVKTDSGLQGGINLYSAEQGITVATSQTTRITSFLISAEVDVENSSL